MNAQKGIKNVLANVFSQVVSIALGIIIPRLVLRNLGSEANGFMNTINQALSYLALLEAGVGAAALQALYAPVASGDHAQINGILSATNRFYHRSGRIYFLIVLVASFVFPATVSAQELTYWEMVAVMLFSGMTGFCTFYFQSKYVVLLQAEGKTYVQTSLVSIIHICTSTSKAILLVLGFGLMQIQLAYFLFGVVQVLFITRYIAKHYQWIDLKAEPNTKAISQSKNALVHQISGMVFHNTDTLLLTYCRGLNAASVYSLYNMLFDMVTNAAAHFKGFSYILGQTYQTDKKRFARYFDLYDTFMITLIFSLFCVAIVFIFPFMKLYTDGVKDAASYLDPVLPYLFLASCLLSSIRSASTMTINIAGHFKQTQKQSILETVINLSVSLVCVFRFGIYGVLFGTITALLYRANDIILYVNRHILHRSPWYAYRHVLSNLVMLLVFASGWKFLLSFVNFTSYWRIILFAIPVTGVTLVCFFTVSALVERNSYHLAKEYLLRRLRRHRASPSTPS